MTAAGDFENLTPSGIIEAVETAVGEYLTGLTSPLPSYINRVYELQTESGTRLIAKFYRPGRWGREAILEEHAFTADCAAEDIPVIAPMPLPGSGAPMPLSGSGAPMPLSGSGTLAEVDGIYFAVFPKKGGRQFEIISDNDWIRIGRLAGRLHVAGSRRSAETRVRLHPMLSTARDLEYLIDGGFVAPASMKRFRDVTSRILGVITPMFDDMEFLRIHGDMHRGNLIFRPDEGIMLIDFDDMMTAPPVQDIWMLLPDHAHLCHREINLILDGYEQFREFDYRSLKLIEPLRIMRIIYFLAWCARQTADNQFRRNFPDWGTENFWRKEIDDLAHQLEIVQDNQ